jgi:hypothetical protein
LEEVGHKHGKINFDAAFWEPLKQGAQGFVIREKTASLLLQLQEN